MTASSALIPRGVLFLLVSLCGMLGGPCHSDSAFAAEAVAPQLPDDVERVWRWFPADTETMIVARDVPWRAFGNEPASRPPAAADEQGEFPLHGFIEWAKQTTLGRLFSLGGGNMLQAGKYLAGLKGHAAPLVVNGGRDYETVSAFGSYRYHGASVIVFAGEDRAKMDQLLATLAADAAEVRRIGDRDVLVFPADKDEMEPTFQLEPWQGTYLVRVEPNVLLCATSDVFLREMLDRIAGTPRDRALPADLPAWKYVDPASSVWGLRRIPKIEDQQLEAVVWLSQPGGRSTLEAFYFPAAGGDAKQHAEMWFMRREQGELTTDPAFHDCVRVLPDGVVQATVRLRDIGDRRASIPQFNFLWLQGLAGSSRR